jgi:putative tryptophan/tyrosine transport system substrate-binding protein
MNTCALVKRRTFLALLGSTAMWPIAAQAQTNLLRVGALVLCNADAESFRKELTDGLSKAGYVEGQNILIDVRSAHGRGELIPKLATELVAAKVDVVVATCTPSTRVAQKTTQTTPIVAIAANLVETDLIANLARPGGMTTGISLMAAEAHGKCVDVFRDLFPALRSVVALGNAGDPLMPLFYETMRLSGLAAGVGIVPETARNQDNLEEAFEAIAKNGAKALVVQGSFPNELVASLALKHRIPAATFARSFAEAGGLFSYGPDTIDAYRRGVSLVTRILQGGKPADIPAEQPTKFELVVNLKTAAALGIEIPPVFLARVDGVIE